jgi:hypothetical protein
MQQDNDQAFRDHTYQEWLNAQNFPLDNINIRYGAISNTPSHAGQSTSTPMYRNRTSGFLGGANSGYNAMGGNNNPYAGWGALVGGLLGAYG